MSNTVYRPAVRVTLGTAFLLMIPLLAMQLGNQVNWTGSDFVVAGALLLGAGALYELVARKAGDTAHRAAAVLAVVSGLFLVWANLAVGIVGDGNNVPDMLYMGVAAVEIIGALVVRFQPRGMARVLFATATVQAVVGVYALTTGLDDAFHVIGINVMFVILFVAAGALFQHVADRTATAG